MLFEEADHCSINILVWWYSSCASILIVLTIRICFPDIVVTKIYKPHFEKGQVPAQGIEIELRENEVGKGIIGLGVLRLAHKKAGTPGAYLLVLPHMFSFSSMKRKMPIRFAALDSHRKSQGIIGYLLL